MNGVSRFCLGAVAAIVILTGGAPLAAGANAVLDSLVDFAPQMLHGSGSDLGWRDARG